MKIVGIDSGYAKFGLACVEGNCDTGYNLIDHEQVSISTYLKNTGLQTNGEQEVYRMTVIQIRVSAFLQVNDPDRIALEFPGYFTRRNEAGIQVNSPSAQKLQKGFAACLTACVQFMLKKGIAPTELHKYILLHDMSIKKNRGLIVRKKQAQERALSIWDIKLKEDEADAAMLALFYGRME